MSCSITLSQGSSDTGPAATSSRGGRDHRGAASRIWGCQVRAGGRKLRDHPARNDHNTHPFMSARVPRTRVSMCPMGFFFIRSITGPSEPSEEPLGGPIGGFELVDKRALPVAFPRHHEPAELVPREPPAAERPGHCQRLLERHALVGVSLDQQQRRGDVIKPRGGGRLPGQPNVRLGGAQPTRPGEIWAGPRVERPELGAVEIRRQGDRVPGRAPVRTVPFWFGGWFGGLWRERGIIAGENNAIRTKRQSSPAEPDGVLTQHPPGTSSERMDASTHSMVVTQFTTGAFAYKGGGGWLSIESHSQHETAQTCS